MSDEESMQRENESLRRQLERAKQQVIDLKMRQDGQQPPGEGAMQAEAMMPGPMVANSSSFLGKLRAVSKDLWQQADDVSAVAELLDSMEFGRRRQALERLLTCYMNLARL